MNKESWNIFNGWGFEIKKDTSYGWSVFDKMSSLINSIFETRKTILDELHRIWDVKLKVYGGEPSNINWNKFRPLKLAREEDWSDWLFFLIIESKTGFFVHDLLKPDRSNQSDLTADPAVSGREISASGYRADLILKWLNNSYTHIEVKIGDESLGKTFNTGEVMRKQHNVPQHDWSDYILLLDYQIDYWLSVSEKKDLFIQHITWNDVALSLRKSLLFSDESVTWKVWAYSYLGAVEQLLLHFKNKFNQSDIVKIDKKISIMQEALING